LRIAFTNCGRHIALWISHNPDSGLWIYPSASPFCSTCINQSCKFAELSEPSELSELSCQLSSGSAQLFWKCSQLSSAQLRFSKNGSAQLSELSELTELTFNDSAKNDVAFLPKRFLLAKAHAQFKYLECDWLIFCPELKSWWLFAKIREKLRSDRPGSARSNGHFYCAPARTQLWDHSPRPKMKKNALFLQD